MREAAIARPSKSCRAVASTGARGTATLTSTNGGPTLLVEMAAGKTGNVTARPLPSP